ncbi:MAG: molybdopterin-guanine dinucleotide biosynthesis protein MobB [Megasphaera sp.]|nr:molybdopterin-guanine dinucleotide biosynthesis protein MobB [Megasphaera sp.]
MTNPIYAHIGLIILAGGRSSRMGCDKASLPWHNGTLLSELLRRSLCLPFREIIISINAPLPDQSLPSAACPLHIVADTYKDCGPLGGLEAALRTGTCDYYAVLSADLPFYDFSPLQDWLAHPQWLTPDTTGLVPILLPVVKGRDQPLAALYPANIYPAVIAALRRHDYRVRSLYDTLPVCRINETKHAFLYTNTNTPSAYKDARACEVSRHRTVPVISITGDHSGVGKTTAATAIIRALHDRGYCIGYIKSTHHPVRAEKKGSDTDRALQSGAAFALTCTPADVPAHKDKEAVLLALSQQHPADLVIIESRCHGPFPRMETNLTAKIALNTTDDVIATLHDYDCSDDDVCHHFSLSHTDRLIPYILTIMGI